MCLAISSRKNQGFQICLKQAAYIMWLKTMVPLKGHTGQLRSHQCFNQSPELFLLLTISLCSFFSALMIICSKLFLPFPLKCHIVNVVGDVGYKMFKINKKLENTYFPCIILRMYFCYTHAGNWPDLDWLHQSFQSMCIDYGKIILFLKNCWSPITFISVSH